MIVRYVNNQDRLDPMNGTAMADRHALSALLDDRRNAPPFVATFRGDHGFELICGIGRDRCCVEHMASSGNVPYLMALSRDPPTRTDDPKFLYGGTLTPIPARYALSFGQFKQIAQYFLETGERSNSVLWEEI
jgi:hypothetical protein